MIKDQIAFAEVFAESNMDVDFLPIYVIVLKILGIVILIVGSVTLYLIATHSAKNGKQYKYTLFVHQFL